MNLLYLIRIKLLQYKPFKVNATRHQTRLSDLLPLFVLTYADGENVSVCLLGSSSECMRSFPKKKEKKKALIHVILAVSYS